jgi:hypothetical protein
MLGLLERFALCAVVTKPDSIAKVLAAPRRSRDPPAAD